MSMIVFFRQSKARHEGDHEERERLRICHDGMTSNGNLKPATAKTSAKAAFAQFHQSRPQTRG